MLWKATRDMGIFTNPVIYPAVAPGQALIRTSYSATHTE
jgi:7-keto-8-aminopelargonate synthetase-like enzyme